MPTDTEVNYVEENPEVNYAEDTENTSTLIDTSTGEPSETDASGVTSDNGGENGDSGSNESSEQVNSEGEPTNVNYEDFYKQCLQTVGKDSDAITPKNLDEVRQLMTQGAQYNSLNKKYEEASKLKSLLDINKIDKGQLDLLIEINNGNTNALAKFLKDKNISPYDINPDDEEDEEPGNKLMQRYILRQRTGFHRIVIFHGLRDIRFGYGAQGAVRHFHESRHIRGNLIYPSEGKSHLRSD